MPASPQYSSVRRGSNMRRKLTLPVEPPVAAVRRLVDHLHAVGEQPFKGGSAVVGEGADDLAVVVAVVRGAGGLHHRPVGEVAVDEVGRVLDAVFLLVAGAAAERQVAAA